MVSKLTYETFTNGIINNDESLLSWNFKAYSLSKETNNESDETEYATAVYNIINSMNTTVNPCDDFFNILVGDGFMSIRYRMISRALLESNDKITPKCIDMARIFYNACMNVDEFSVTNIEQLIEMFRKIGKWPLLESDWKKYTLNMTDMLALITETFGDSILFRLFVDAEAKNTTIHNSLELVLNRANISYDVSQLATDVNDIIAFEIELAKIDWVKFMIRLTPTSIHDIIDNNTNIIIQEVQYMRNLSNLLSITNERTLANYIFWRTIDSWDDILGSKFDDIRLKLMHVMNGQQKLMPRWQRCVQKSEDVLAQATGALFVRKHFNLKTRKEVTDILENIREAFRDIVKEIDWMDNNTKNAALKKADAMISKVGYHDISMNDTALNEYYKRAANYGAIGTVMGHELTHGFDDDGSLYDMNGNLNNWWSDESYKNFKNKAQCFIEQYGSYKVPNTDFKVNGKLTLGENIADNGGIKQSFRAYRNYMRQIGHSGDSGHFKSHLPGISNFTNDQLFFLSFAQVWCSHQTKEAQIKQVLTNEHSPAMYRVNGALSNLPEFSKTFNCPSGSLLNPRKRCSVW
ncbi:hypothetical protein DINM_020296 [Dirofilaria immitis]|nr:hypothetical protein [Dirofilaria immitis]